MTAEGDPGPPGGSPWLAMMPAVFVVVWSTGFIGSKLGLPYAPPFTFLLVRFVVVVAALAVLAVVLRSPWPRDRQRLMHGAVVGVLLHGFYLGGVFMSIGRGLPAGITALIVGLQPLVTALAAGVFFGEPVSLRQWFGLVLGFLGCGLVVAEKLGGGVVTFGTVVPALVALAGITAGTLYQKRHGGQMNLITGSIVQFSAAAVAMLPVALAVETMRIEWTAEFIFALLWLSLVLSIGAVSLFYLMIRRGAAAKVVSLFYLTPGVTAVMGYFLFGESLAALAIVGMAVAGAGVAVATRG